MSDTEHSEPEDVDISLFEIPPAAAYFETIQQLQKVNAKLDVLIGHQCEILAALNSTDVDSNLDQARSEVARLYEAHLLRYFGETDIDKEALKRSIHHADRRSAEADLEDDRPSANNSADQKPAKGDSAS
ncbi:MAG: hypothetical protein BMS9Abin05_2693 [Rhodothermia bacterium]|nr:MAG: hypothetical protein BMS9Abin05_2693 [Rhodothermia bacterium]